MESSQIHLYITCLDQRASLTVEQRKQQEREGRRRHQGSQRRKTFSSKTKRLRFHLDVNMSTTEPSAALLDGGKRSDKTEK